MSLGSEARIEIMCNQAGSNDNYYELDSNKWLTGIKWNDMYSSHIINVFNYLRKNFKYLVLDRKLYKFLIKRELDYLVKSNDEIK